ncbi:MAG TPA: hypothetical protein DHV44_10095 [Providencia sp.]|nr:hypothetical protein [Providencia sp.]
MNKPFFTLKEKTCSIPHHQKQSNDRRTIDKLKYLTKNKQSIDSNFTKQIKIRIKKNLKPKKEK